MSRRRYEWVVGFGRASMVPVLAACAFTLGLTHCGSKASPPGEQGGTGGALPGSGGAPSGSGGAADATTPDGGTSGAGGSSTDADSGSGEVLTGNGCAGGVCQNPDCLPYMGKAAPVDMFPGTGFEDKPSFIPPDDDHSHVG